MANTFTAPFAQTTKTGSAVVTAADSVTNDTPSNTGLIATAGVNGALVTRLTAIPRATVTATALHLFISSDSGTTKRLADSALMSAHTVATSTAIPQSDFSDITSAEPLRLAAGDELYVGAGKALVGGIVFKIEWSDF